VPGGALPNPAQIAGSRWQYAVAVLDGVNAPHPSTKIGGDANSGIGNVYALLAWMKAEGGSAHFNPMNTTQKASGSTPYNSAGVQNYTSWNQGIQATVATLTNGSYGPVLAALRGDKGAQAIAQAVGASPWGTDGQLMAQVAQGWGNGHGAASIQAISFAGGQVAGVAGADLAGQAFDAVKGAVTAPLGWGEAIAKFLGKLLDRQTWIRFAEILGGLVLGIGGLIVLAHALGADQAVAGVAGKLAPLAAA
jgi:hypothetical protein